MKQRMTSRNGGISIGIPIVSSASGASIRRVSIRYLVGGKRLRTIFGRSGLRRCDRRSTKWGSGQAAQQQSTDILAIGRNT